MVDEVGLRSPWVVNIQNPYFLAEDRLHSDVYGDHDEDPYAPVEKYSEAAPIPVVLIPQDESSGREKEHELHACVTCILARLHT